jgi:hypothetical protein
MIELEIQTLSERREGLLVAVGRSVTASGFVVQRQRLTEDANGVMMTLVVGGPPRKQRVLEAALETHERLISFQVSPFEQGEAKPHFAAARKLPRPPVAAAAVPAPVVKRDTVPAPPVDPPKSPAPVIATPAALAAVEALLERAEPAETDFELILPTPKAVPAPAAAEIAPFVDVMPLEADEPAVDKALRELEQSWPQVMPSLLALGSSVAAGARESSLMLAGQRVGAWVLRHEHAQAAGLDLPRAIETIAVPALQALVAVERDGDQLHILDSPLCHEDGHSGCAFFNGFLQSILEPTLGSQALTIFPVCCRSYGADACVLALSI